MTVFGLTEGGPTATLREQQRVESKAADVTPASGQVLALAACELRWRLPAGRRGARDS